MSRLFEKLRGGRVDRHSGGNESPVSRGIRSEDKDAKLADERIGGILADGTLPLTDTPA
jgi:hypothetical protein